MKLELRGMTKRFGDLVACDHIDLTVQPGEICALLGENGAGKSTLMNVLYGLHHPDEGQVLVDDAPVRITDPRAAMRLGIGMVHQHFMLVPVFTVAENLMLGREPNVFGFLQRARAADRVRELSQRYGLDVDPDSRVEDLPVGVQQRVEIIKALAGGAELLILDEPTAVLTPQEIDELLRVMRDLKNEGRSIVFISHKLKEVQEIADRVVVIRRGRVVGERPPETPESELAELMVGRSVSLDRVERTEPVGDVRLQIDGVTVVDHQGVAVVDEVSLDVRSGEILAVAGVQGNGQSELAELLLGLDQPTAGRVTLDGADITRTRPDRSLAAGIGYVPEDRSHDGYVAGFSVAENLVLDLLDDARFSRNGLLSVEAIQRNAEERVAEFDVRTQSIATPVGSLSGGNQQKVVLAREMSRPLRLMVASQPTRGLDVGSIEFVHGRIRQARDEGTAVLLVSTELDEIYQLADRIAVMCRGRIVGVVGAGVSRETLGLMMTGVAPEASEGQAS